MRMEFFAVQLVGAAVALAGVSSLAALSLPDYRWYNRVAVVVGLGFCTCLVVIADLTAPRFAAPRPVDPLGFALVSVALGLCMLGIFNITIRSSYDLYPEAASRMASAVNLISAGIVLQVVPSLLGLVGVPIW